MTDSGSKPGPDGTRASQCEQGELADADVIVVGAGPAGASTAGFLARQGVDVLVLDKDVFPRPKVCGDGLTPRAVRMMTRLGIDTSAESGWKRTKGLRIYGGKYSYDNPLDMPWPELSTIPNYGLVCPREVFDDIVAGAAIDAGARVVTGVKVDRPLIDARSGRVTGVVTADGTQLKSALVVAADGNSARMALGVNRQRNEKRPMGVAVRTYFRSPKSDLDWLESHLQLWDGTPGESDLLPGYSWVFGSGDGTANVGLGMLSTSAAFKGTNYRDLLRRWADHTPEEWGFREQNQVGAIQGAALPMALNRKPMYADGLLLVGDSAGMTSPFNGEGISYAMEAGEFAARAIADAQSRGFGTSAAELALNSYPAQVKQEFGGYFRLGTIFASLIGNPTVMELCVKYGLPRRRLMVLVNKLLANLTDRNDPDLADVIINVLSDAAPST